MKDYCKPSSIIYIINLKERDYLKIMEIEELRQRRRRTTSLKEFLEYLEQSH